MRSPTLFVIAVVAMCVTSMFGALPACETNGYSPSRIYRITDLSTLGGAESKAHWMNYYGSIVGESKTVGNSNTHAFVWTPASGMVELGPKSAFRTVARKAFQIIVGEWQETPDSPVRAVWWDNDGAMHVIPTLGGASNVATAVDCNGWISGISSLRSSPILHAFSYRPGTGNLIDLGALGGGNSMAEGSGECFWVVGSAQISPSSPYHAFLFRTFLEDLGTLGGRESFGYSSSASGEIVGRSDVVGGGSHAFFYNSRTGGPMIDLGTLGGTSAAVAINDDGLIVGWSTVAGSADTHAVLWNNGHIIDLNTASATNCGWRLLEAATCITPGGQIVGFGITDAGERHGFLLTAVPGGVGNEPPSVQFVTPRPEEKVVPGNNIHLEVMASDPDGTITNVTFSFWICNFVFCFGEEIGVKTSAPFQIDWQAAGAFPGDEIGFWVTAWDNRGAPASTSVSVVAVAQPATVLTIARIDNGFVRISWAPEVLGSILQTKEVDDGSDWTDSPTGTMNPVAVSPSDTARLFRVIERR